MWNLLLWIILIVIVVLVAGWVLRVIALAIKLAFLILLIYILLRVFSIL